MREFFFKFFIFLFLFVYCSISKNQILEKRTAAKAGVAAMLPPVLRSDYKLFVAYYYLLFFIQTNFS